MDRSVDEILLNPRLPVDGQDRIRQHVEKHMRGEHMWLMSSGTESQRGGRLKMVALSKDALIAAARGVNQFFSITSQDVIYNALPKFHVSGLLQMTRAQESGARLVQAPELAWNAETYCQELVREQVTITSLVPTQIYDLVQAQQPAPSSLRCVFAGGGVLSDFLFQQAQALGWPLVRTYGMTETCAMIAYKDKATNLWRRLPHLEKWESTSEQKIKFLGPSLLSGYLLIDQESSEWLDPKKQGWFESDDRGEIIEDGMVLLGRDSEIVKIKGETVSLAEMNEKWLRFCQEQNLSQNSVIVSLPHERDGHEIVLATEECLLIEQIAPFQKQLLPFQKIQRVFAKTLIPRTDLGKIRSADLIQNLKSI